MNLNNSFLYLFTFISSFILSLVLTPAARAAAIVLNIYDHPISTVKTHKNPVPYLGGIAIFIGFSFSLLWIRILTSFPSGTLHTLRGIMLGGLIMFSLGLIDDIKHHGLHYRLKFLVQILAASLVVSFGIRIHFIHPPWLATIISIVWIVGVTNAFNLIDIMDGLASGICVVCSMAFLLISLPTEAIYVNFASAALAGGALGFLPFNLSKSWRIFMGDSGSLFLGFVSSSVALGTSYGEKTEVGVFAPLVILSLPIFDTLLVFVLRMLRGSSPFLGSKDHFALRLEALGWNRKRILIFSIAFTVLLCIGAFVVTRVDLIPAIAVYALIFVLLAFFTSYVLKHKIDK